ncbi:MAG TPA: hypothetical protein VKZ77_09775 [Bacillaceae bacterium]|nr:hypothetical protein [Paenibacillus bovis]HLU22754.1 hypothetical protein [Bacillaceae bacterium]
MLTTRTINILLLPFLFTLLFFIPKVLADSNNIGKPIPKEIEQFATSSAINLFKEIVSEDPEGYGFNDINEVENVTLGPGYQLYAIDGERLKDDKYKKMSEISYETTIYEYIVYSKGVPKSFITISTDDKGVFLSSAGGIASGIEKTLNSFNSLSVNLNESKHEIFVVHYGVSDKYFILKTKDKEEIIPFSPNGENKAEINGKVYSSEQIVDHIRNENEKYKDAEPGLTGNLGSIAPIQKKNNYILIGSISLGIALFATLLFYIIPRRADPKR